MRDHPSQSELSKRVTHLTARSVERVFRQTGNTSIIKFYHSLSITSYAKRHYWKRHDLIHVRISLLTSSLLDFKHHTPPILAPTLRTFTFLTPLTPINYSKTTFTMIPAERKPQLHTLRVMSVPLSQIIGLIYTAIRKSPPPILCERHCPTYITLLYKPLAIALNAALSIFHKIHILNTLFINFQTTFLPLNNSSLTKITPYSQSLVHLQPNIVTKHQTPTRSLTYFSQTLLSLIT